MNTPRELLKILEEHKGRKLDLNNSQDRTRFFMVLQRELDKNEVIISNVKKVLDGESTYDKRTYKVILDSNRRKS